MISTIDPSGFTDEQTCYLQGFVSGILNAKSLPFLGRDEGGRFTHREEEAVEMVYNTPVEDLCREERIKYERHGLDCYETILENAGSDRFPESGDVFRYKYHGLFYVSPAEESFMLRARVAGGSLTAVQLRGMAEIARDWGAGAADITTRANLQIRGIAPRDAPSVLMKLTDLGLTSQGSGADNIRNITATPTSGFDPAELIDVMPYAKALHHAILRSRDLYGLPRKFNVAYDSGGSVSVCADTNDIGFQAVRLSSQVGEAEPGVYFRMQLCGITGHRQFAADCGLLVRPQESLPLAAALIRVFIEHGDRSNRKRARLKYLVDDWGVDRLLEEVGRKLAFPLMRVPLEACDPAGHKDRLGHLGCHVQADGNHYLGVRVPVGRMSVDQMLALASLAERCGSGDLRLTVWQNLIVPNIPQERLTEMIEGLERAGLAHLPSPAAAGLVACTGNRGCRYASADTKGHAVLLARHLEERLPLDRPVNIHLTGCPHSCAQHYIGDIGLIAVQVRMDDGSSEEGYHVVLGGGTDERQGIAREMWKSVPWSLIPDRIERLLRHYLDGREGEEDFVDYIRRQDLEGLRASLG